MIRKMPLDCVRTMVGVEWECVGVERGVVAVVVVILGSVACWGVL